MNALMRWGESEHAVMTMIWASVLDVFQELGFLAIEGNRDAVQCHQEFYERLNPTPDATQLLLGHLITSGGLDWHQQLPHARGLTTREFVNGQIATLLPSFCSRLAVDWGIFQAASGHVLANGRFKPDENIEQFWLRMRAGLVMVDRKDYSFRPVADMVDGCRANFLLNANAFRRSRPACQKRSGRDPSDHRDQ
jgi:hypothetical protein